MLYYAVVEEGEAVEVVGVVLQIVVFYLLGCDLFVLFFSPSVDSCSIRRIFGSISLVCSLSLIDFLFVNFFRADRYVGIR